jgi:phosphohistidine phosphatase
MAIPIPRNQSQSHRSSIMPMPIMVRVMVGRLHCPVPNPNPSPRSPIGSVIGTRQVGSTDPSRVQKEKMERQLFLLRHAKSSWDDMSIPDHDRPLNNRGRKAAAAMHRLFQSAGICPDLVCVSSARRTMQTLAALEPWNRPPMVEVKEALYHAPGPKILELVRDIPSAARTVLLIGHNPGLHEFAMLLAGDSDDALVRRLAEAYPTGALAQFEFSCLWSQVEMGSGKLTRFVAPRELKSPTK